MFIVVSSCPQCGAPIWVPQIWGGVTPPPPIFSCDCKKKRTLPKYEDVCYPPYPNYFPKSPIGGWDIR